MSVGLKVRSFWYEIGHSDFLHAFFSTISYHLESGNWGSKYPLLLNNLYSKKLDYELIPKAIEEIIEIRAKLAEYPSSKIIWDIDDISKKRPLSCSNIKRTGTLADYFVTVSGKNIFDLLKEVFEEAKQIRAPIEITGLFENNAYNIKTSKNKGIIIENNLGIDWGKVTPEFYNQEKNIVVHVFNHNLNGLENLNRTIKFAIGRIKWFKNFFPDGCKQEIVFDDRDQNINEKVRNIIFDKLSNEVTKIRFLSNRS